MSLSPRLLLALAGLVAGSATIAFLPASVLFTPPEKPAAAAGEAGARYACPMMDFIGQAPGSCPVCGMDMAKVTAGELTREQQRRMGVETVTVAEGPAAVMVRASGIVDYDHRFTTLVVPRVAGRIVKRYDPTWGCCEDVAAGAAIVDLYSPEAFAAQGELLAAKNLGDEAAVRALRERFVRWNLADVADAVLAGQPPTDTVTIRAPAAGQVYFRDFEAVNQNVALGREVAADVPLLTLVDPVRLTVTLQLPERAARFVREGQAVELESDDLGPLPGVEAVVERLGREVSADLRTREVRVYLSDAAQLLAPGAHVAARIRGALGPDLLAADPTDAAATGVFPLVPKDAILSTGVRHVAWRVVSRSPDGRVRFEPVPVALGPRIEDAAGRDVFVVRAGLRPGDEVAARGAFLIDSQAQLAGTASLLFPQGAVAPAAESAHPHSH